MDDKEMIEKLTGVYFDISKGDSERASSELMDVINILTLRVEEE